MYDMGGNITSKKEYAVTSGTPTGSYVGSDYSYATEGWKDQLVSFNGEQCVYDEIGNPTTYRNHNLSWTKVRRLARFDNHTFEYNASGIRTKKNNITYTLDGNKILKQEGNSETEYLTFYYGINGIVGFNYWGTDYYYVKNLQGDVYEIYQDDNGTPTCVAKYEYDAWGNIVAITDGNGTDVSNDPYHIANVNPIRYRSYYYDRETNLYYLESRYYDPETGRFLNADRYITTGTGFMGFNMFVYCNNNPVNYSDASGAFLLATIAGAIIGGIAGGISAMKSKKSIVAGVVTGAATGAGIGYVCDSVAGSIATGGVATGAYVAGGIALCGAIGMAGNFSNQLINYEIDKKIAEHNGKKMDDFADYIDVNSIVVSGIASATASVSSIGAGIVVNFAFSGLSTGIDKVAKGVADVIIGSNANIWSAIIDWISQEIFC